VARVIGLGEAAHLWSLLLWLQKEASLADVDVMAKIERRRKWSAAENAD
jgi:hypothetical protein